MFDTITFFNVYYTDLSLKSNPKDHYKNEQQKDNIDNQNSNNRENIHNPSSQEISHSSLNIVYFLSISFFVKF